MIRLLVYLQAEWPDADLKVAQNFPEVAKNNHSS